MLVASLIALNVGPHSTLSSHIRTGFAKNLLTGALMAGMSTAFIVSISRIDAATTLFLQSLAPFPAALLGWLLLRERVDSHTWAAMGTAVVGVAIMASSWDLSDALGVSAAACIAVMLGVYTVLLRSSQNRDPRVPVIFAALIGILIGSVGTAMTSGFGLPISDALLALASGGILLGIGLPIFNLAGRYVPAARTSLLLLSEIVLAPFWVWLIVSETPEPNTLIGGTIILAALVWVASHPLLPQHEN
jgi:drug/metabolite transporter (DMT)-like permease|tara:strand:- start:4887 stop:5627 length:741 start_codon:yes stop_codon:yes gene_type:complete